MIRALSLLALLTVAAAGVLGAQGRSDYFRRQCYVAVEEVEPGLDAFVREYPDNVLFASDYPHADGTFPGAAKALLDTDLLDDSTRWGLLRENAIRLYGLE